MTRRGLVGALALSVAAVGTVVLAPRWGGEAPVHADRLALAETVFARTRDFRTAYLSGPVVVQVDVGAELLVLDDPDRDRILWDGQTLWWTRAGRAPQALPAEWAARVRAVWDEWRAGFPNATVVDASPRELDPYWYIHRTEKYFRIDLPYPWLAPYAVYVRTNLQGTWGSVVVLDRATAKPLKIAGHEVDKVLVTEAERDVPLDPDSYSPEWPAYPVRRTSRATASSPGCLAHCPTRHLPWHDLQTFVALEPDGDNDGNGPTVWSTCPAKGTTETASQRLVFRMPDDPERVALAMTAARECEDAVFRMAIEGSHDPGPGQKSCFSGTWRIVDARVDPPVTLIRRQFQRCRQGPSDDTLPYRVELPLPAGYDLTHLEVWVESEVTISCRKQLTSQGGTALSIPPADRPVLEWPGCYPGFDP